HSGFPDLTVVYGPGHYEFVEVKGPGDQLQIHQRLWIEALERRRLPVRVLRYRCA
ncbi:MAG: VRR-NUC domain-containing protein, partial [Pseudomonadales bacterium]|nr:VRR-NUC domain-containing protein [Pseudomonadales bacterium]